MLVYSISCEVYKTNITRVYDKCDVTKYSWQQLRIVNTSGALSLSNLKTKIKYGRCKYRKNSMSFYDVYNKFKLRNSINIIYDIFHLMMFGQLIIHKKLYIFESHIISAYSCYLCKMKDGPNKLNNFIIHQNNNNNNRTKTLEIKFTQNFCWP